jgi:glutaredoxin-related protein
MLAHFEKCSKCERRMDTFEQYKIKYDNANLMGLMVTI